MSDPITLALAKILGLPAHASKCVLTLEAGMCPQVVVTYMPKPPEQVEQRFELVPAGPCCPSPLDLDRMASQACSRLALANRDAAVMHRHKHRELLADILIARQQRHEVHP